MSNVVSIAGYLDRKACRYPASVLWSDVSQFWKMWEAQLVSRKIVHSVEV